MRSHFTPVVTTLTSGIRNRRGGYLNAQLGVDLDLPIGAISTEQKDQRLLQNGVFLFAHIPLLNRTVHVIAVRPVAGREELFDRNSHRLRNCAHVDSIAQGGH